MKKYRVRFGPLAVLDLDASFEWGVGNWGDEAAEEWLDEFETNIEQRLSESPNAYPVAPESSELITKSGS